MATQIDVASTLTVVNETDKRGQQILTLISANIPGIRGGYYGFRPFGQDTIQFPCVMVECSLQMPRMVTTGKYYLEFVYNIYFFVTEDNSDAIVTLQAFTAEALIELFSNSQFKVNQGFWTNSEIRRVALSTTFINPKENRSKYMRVGVMQLELQDFVIK